MGWLSKTNIPGPKSVNGKAYGFWGEVIPLAILCLSILAYLFFYVGLIRLKISIPYDYQGDSITTLALVKRIITEGTVYQSSYLGAPFEFNLYDFPIGDMNSVGLIYLLGVFLKNPFVIFNLFLILGFILNGVAFYLSSRALNLDKLSSYLFALLFAFPSYAFYRSQGHAFLAHYYAIPAAAWLAFSLYYHPNRFRLMDPKTGRVSTDPYLIISALLVILIGFSGFYYSFFSLLMIGAVGLVSTLRRKSLQPLIKAIWLGTGVIGTVLMAVTPVLLWWSSHTTHFVTKRYPIAQRLYGLRMGDMVIPGFYIFPFARKHVINYTSERTTEGVSDYPGLIASLIMMGLVGLALIVPFLHRELANRLLPRRRRWVVILSAFLVTGAILFGVTNGFGYLFNTFILSVFRAQTRISISITFLALLAAAILFNHMIRPRKKTVLHRRWMPLIAAGLVLGTLFIQGSFYRFNPDHPHSWQQEQNAANYLQELGLDNGVIFQLPVIPFPESPPVNQMGSYDHLKIYLQTSSAKFSFGASNGSKNLYWQQAITTLPSRELGYILAAAGFDAILLNKTGYPDGGVQLTKGLKAALNNEDIIEDDRWVLVNLKPTRRNLVWAIDPGQKPGDPIPTSLKIQWPQEFSPLERQGSNYWRWDNSQNGSATLLIENNNPEKRTLRFAGTVAFPTSEKAPFTVHGCGKEYTLAVQKDPMTFDWDFECDPGTHKFIVTAAAPRFNAPGINRNMHFQLLNFKLEDNRWNDPLENQEILNRLRNMALNIPLIRWGSEGLSNLERDVDHYWHTDDSPNGEVKFHIQNPSSTLRRYRFVGVLHTPTAEQAKGFIRGCGLEKEISTHNTSANLDLVFECPPGDNVIELKVNVARLNAPNDPRRIHFRIMDFRLIDEEFYHLMDRAVLLGGNPARK